MGSVLALDELLDQRLEDELDEIAGFLNAQHARLVGVTARLLANPGTWQVPGIHTIEQYLCWRTGISAAHAHQIAAIANRVDELPDASTRSDRGELSLDQMAAIVPRHRRGPTSASPNSPRCSPCVNSAESSASTGSPMPSRRTRPTTLPNGNRSNRNPSRTADATGPPGGFVPVLVR